MTRSTATAPDTDFSAPTLQRSECFFEDLFDDDTPPLRRNDHLPALLLVAAPLTAALLGLVVPMFSLLG